MTLTAPAPPTSASTSAAGFVREVSDRVKARLLDTITADAAECSAHQLERDDLD